MKIAARTRRISGFWSRRAKEKARRDAPRANAYYEGARRDLICFIPAGARNILDIGCGAGMTGAILKDQRGADIRVVGVEIVPDIGEKARKRLDEVIIGNVETMELPFSREYFDCILYGDILEHLVDPWGTVARHVGFLKAGGYVIASVPNIAHYRVLKMLKRGEWNYADSGILDRTHLRFFTKKALREMFDSSGLEIKRIEHKIGASKMKKFLSGIFLNAFIDSITEQYIVVAQKRAAHHKERERTR